MTTPSQIPLLLLLRLKGKPERDALLIAPSGRKGAARFGRKVLRGHALIKSCPKTKLYARDAKSVTAEAGGSQRLKPPLPRHLQMLLLHYEFITWYKVQQLYLKCNRRFN